MVRIISNRFEPYRILGMSNSPTLPTGYGNVIRHIFQRLSYHEMYEPHILGWYYKGLPMNVEFDVGVGAKREYMSDFKRPGTIRLWGEGAESYGKDMLGYCLKRARPHLLWVLCDMFMIQYLAERDVSPAKLMVYYPTDGEYFPVWADKVLEKAEYRVAMSKHGQKQVKDLFGLDSHCIWHGVNTNVFYPFDGPQKYDNRVKWSAILSNFNNMKVDLTNKFILVFMGRFQGRKAVPELMKILGEFAKDKDDVAIVMHSDPNDPANRGQVDAFDLVKKVGLLGKAFFTGITMHTPVDEATMNSIYNLADVQVSATTGEGFGIGTIEGFAAGVPMVITDYTSTKELVVEPKTGIGVPIMDEVMGTFNVNRGMVDKKAFVEALNSIYYDRKKLKSMADRCRPWALNNFDWDKVIFPQWLKYFDKVLP